MSAYSENEGTRYYGDATNVYLKVKEAEILIPNLFVQKSKELNHSFEILGLEQFADSNLYIVNRWGKEVYKAKEYINNWTPEGLEEGNYYYLLMTKETINCD
ncbi:gliding motility-associated C-terminal domain-containing protein [Pedobacter aquatilis]|uniref:T9SS type B sorting domain-containing protein n=1 Tax=Pedobacter aquatilis TaxID=351343 RepID=UPI00292E39FE|nr:gliding motility-associated C-terminal domain-containing protein [Pedobacter aquatilis]